MATCPYCDATINRLNLQEMTSSSFMGQGWQTIAYVCPFCQKIISVSIDPIAIRADILNAIQQKRGGA